MLDEIIEIEASELDESGVVQKLDNLLKAEVGAGDSFSINSDTTAMRTALEKAKDYQTAIMIYANHTIVFITDHDKFEPSRGWKMNMPWGIGFTRKNKRLNKKENTINSPSNSGKRTLYLFD